MFFVLRVGTRCDHRRSGSRGFQLSAGCFFGPCAGLDQWATFLLADRALELALPHLVGVMRLLRPTLFLAKHLVIRLIYHMWGLLVPEKNYLFSIPNGKHQPLSRTSVWVVSGFFLQRKYQFSKSRAKEKETVKFFTCICHFFI